MYQKLFHITLVLFLVVVSVATLAVVITAIMSAFSSAPLAGGYGITFAVGGGTARQVGFMIVAASLVVAGVYLFWRRRRFHR
jgi:multisubunit Na+/H+ antiporter MnhC subunit